MTRARQPATSRTSIAGGLAQLCAAPAYDSGFSSLEGGRGVVPVAIGAVPVPIGAVPVAIGAVPVPIGAVPVPTGGVGIVGIGPNFIGPNGFKS